MHLTTQKILLIVCDPTRTLNGLIPPTLREISAVIGCSHQNVANGLKTLRTQGYLAPYEKGDRRASQPTRKAYELLEAISGTPNHELANSARNILSVYASAKFQGEGRGGDDEHSAEEATAHYDWCSGANWVGPMCDCEMRPDPNCIYCEENVHAPKNVSPDYNSF